MELALSVIDLGNGPEALPAVEIEPESGVFDYASRYSPGLTEYHAPARLADDVAARATALAVRVHEVLGLADLSRTGFVNGDISTVMSPRTVISWAQNAHIFGDVGYAFRVSFLNKCVNKVEISKTS